jgi:hypothetical protein
VLAFLASSKRVDLRWLDERQKSGIRTVLDRLHNEKRLSLLRISKEAGRSYTSIWGICRALEVHTRSGAEANKESAEPRSKYKRKAFDGDEGLKNYVLGFRHGDLTAWQVSGTAVMVTSTTTHPAFVELFRRLFQEHGHVYQYPMYDKDVGYKWKVAVRLDNSFRFLLTSAEATIESLAHDRQSVLSWFAGLVDADGSIYFTNHLEYVRINLAIGMTRPNLLKAIRTVLGTLGYKADGPYLVFEAGLRTPRGITYTNDLWRIYFQRSKETQQLLKELPLRHSEKVAYKELALSVSPPAKWTDIETSALRLRNEIDHKTERFIEEAKEKYLKRKPRLYNRAAGK